MIKRILTIITVTSFIFTLTGQKYGLVNTQNLNMRIGPSQEFSQIDQLHLGDTVEIKDTIDSWSRVNYKGEEGYVSTDYLEIIEIEENSTIKKQNDDDSYIGIIFILIVAIIIIITFIRVFIFRKKSSKKSQTKPKKKSKQLIHICKHCGAKNKNLKTLTSLTCLNSPTNKHQPLEGGVKDMYHCKHCGSENKNLKTLMSLTCLNSPTNKHQPL